MQIKMSWRFRKKKRLDKILKKGIRKLHWLHFCGIICNLTTYTEKVCGIQILWLQSTELLWKFNMPVWTKTSNKLLANRVTICGRNFRKYVDSISFTWSLYIFFHVGKDLELGPYINANYHVLQFEDVTSIVIVSRIEA